jgi:hypothetical protein
MTISEFEWFAETCREYVQMRECPHNRSACLKNTVVIVSVFFDPLATV